MQRSVLFSGIVCLLLFSGCLGLVSDEDIQTTLNVSLSDEHLVVETVYEQGERISSSTVTVEFDFSGSTSDVAIQTFGLITDDGRSSGIYAEEQTTLSLDFEHHGMYTIELYAVDEIGNNVTESKTIVIEQVITWTEEDSGNPQSLFFDATPGNDGPSPSYLMLNSTITNPSPLLEINGRDVDVEWAVINVDGQCMGHREIIENGDSASWNTLHFAPIEMHEVELTIHEGQDSVDVIHRIELRYSQ